MTRKSISYLWSRFFGTVNEEAALLQSWYDKGFNASRIPFIASGESPEDGQVFTWDDEVGALVPVNAGTLEVDVVGSFSDGDLLQWDASEEHFKPLDKSAYRPASPIVFDAESLGFSSPATRSAVGQTRVIVMPGNSISQVYALFRRPPWATFSVVVWWAPLTTDGGNLRQRLRRGTLDEGTDLDLQAASGSTLIAVPSDQHETQRTVLINGSSNWSSNWTGPGGGELITHAWQRTVNVDDTAGNIAVMAMEWWEGSVDA